MPPLPGTCLEQVVARTYKEETIMLAPWELITLGFWVIPVQEAGLTMTLRSFGIMVFICSEEAA